MRRGITGLVIGVALAAGATDAPAATTFGSNLNGSPSKVSGTSSTFASQTLDPLHAAPGGAVAPSNGVIVRWRIKVGAEGSGQAAALRVIRNNVGHGRGATEAVPAAAGTYVYSARLPVDAGDQIGVDTSDQLAFIATGAAQDTYEYWNPALADGGTVGTSPSEANLAGLILLNADIEPDVDGDGYGDETQDACPGNAASQLPPCDGTAPETTITSQPKARRTAKAAQFAFSSTEVGSTFECSIDGAPFIGCLSPLIRTVGLGPHVFQVRATDAAGNVDQSPAIVSWRVIKKKQKHHHKHHHSGHHQHG